MCVREIETKSEFASLFSKFLSHSTSNLVFLHTILSRRFYCYISVFAETHSRHDTSRRFESMFPIRGCGKLSKKIENRKLKSERINHEICQY